MEKTLDSTLRDISVHVLQNMAGREDVIKGLLALMPSGGIYPTAEETAKNEVSITKPLARQKMIKYLKDWYAKRVAGVRNDEDDGTTTGLGSFIIFSMGEHIKWDGVLDGLLAIASPKM